MTRQEREGQEEGAIRAQKGEYVGKVLIIICPVQVSLMLVAYVIFRVLGFTNINVPNSHQ
jgi:hypothetical protein